MSCREQVSIFQLCHAENKLHLSAMSTDYIMLYRSLQLKYKYTNVGTAEHNVLMNLFSRSLKGIWKCGLYEQLSFIYRLKLYALFIDGKNETVLYRQWFVIWKYCMCIQSNLPQFNWLIDFWCFNATFNNISKMRLSFIDSDLWYGNFPLGQAWARVAQWVR
jgi:hypothetical protein